MNKNQFLNLILDHLEDVNKRRVNENLSREGLIFNSGQRDALTLLLEKVSKW